MAKLEKILIVPDTHVPFHDRRAWKLLLKAAKTFQPDHVIILGDFADFYSVSSHSKNPNRENMLDKEIEEVKKCLRELKDLGAKNNQFISGNHCDRLERYLQDKAPELFNIVTVDKVLQLKEIGFEYTPYKSFYKLGKLHVTHDVGTAGRYAHYKALDTFQRNVVTGHTHRMGFAVEGNAEGKRHVAASFGWLGDITQVDYMHKINATKHWCLGFGLGYMDAKTKHVHLVPVPIVDYTVLIEGKLIKG